MRILVLSQAYPSECNKYAMSYVHTRCLAYIKENCSVTVINFSALTGYTYEGVSVVADGLIDVDAFDVVVSHAPNIKNHVRFLNKLRNKKVFFFFHGHEVLKTGQDYPEPYYWNKPTRVGYLSILAYDSFKIFIIRHWLRKMSRRNTIGIVFVSDWMRVQFERNMKAHASEFGNFKVIPNSVHDAFLKESYKPESFLADFITIRPLNESKYSVDLVVSLAITNPELSFHLYGKGRFFDYVEKPRNLQWFDEYVSQTEIPKLLNKYKAALMPTRYDAQGVMVCEMASFGIPVLTTDFPVCVEMLNGFENVKFMPVSEFSHKLTATSLHRLKNKNYSFDSNSLVKDELGFFHGA